MSELLKGFNSACQSTFSAISKLGTNILYTAKHSSCPFIHRKPVCLQLGGEPAYLLGRSYDYENKQ